MSVSGSAATTVCRAIHAELSVAHGLITQDVLLHEQRLLGDNALFAIGVDREAHGQRVRQSTPPELDHAMLSTWEWAQLESVAPPRVVALLATVFADESWRRATETATRWKAFGPAFVLINEMRTSDYESCLLECLYSGIGMMTLARDRCVADVCCVPEEQRPIKRRTINRWIEESLYHGVVSKMGTSLDSLP